MNHQRVVWCMESFGPFGRLMADTLDAHLVIDGPIPDCDSVHIVGMVDTPAYAVTRASTQRARRRVIHWCGPDVLYLWRTEEIPEAVHLCDSENLRQELSARGIDAAIVPLPAMHDLEVEPMPAFPTVSMYHGRNPSWYGSSMLPAIQECLPDVRFITYAQEQYDSRGMRDLIAETSVHLRLTRHDGGALSAKEYMESGRRVVMTHELPYAIKVGHDDLPTIVSALSEALRHTEPDTEAAGYWHDQNSRQRFLSDLREAL